MLGQRGIWHDGWKAVTEHGPMAGTSNFDDDPWQLFHTDVDRAEAHDLAEQHPEKVEEMKAIWMQEAEANKVLPLNDLQIIGNPKDFETFVAMEFHIPVPPSGQYTYYPGTWRSRSVLLPTCTTCRTRRSPRSISSRAPKASSSPTAPGSAAMPC